MENNHFIDLDNSTIKNERPSFLTVLCIITFIVSGIYIVSGIFNLFPQDIEVQVEAIEEVVLELEEQNTTGDASVSNFINNYKTLLEDLLYNGQTLGIISLLSGILSVMGAFFMYNMNKIGFHIYVVSKLVGWSSILIHTSFNGLVIAWFVVPGIFTLAFIFMYASNLKHFKKDT